MGRNTAVRLIAYSIYRSSRIDWAAPMPQLEDGAQMG